MKHQKYHRDAYWALVIETLFILTLCPLIGSLKGLLASASWLIGGLLAVAPTIFLYRRVFAFFGARQANRILKAFYWGEAIKFLLTGMGFAGAFLIPWLQPLWLFLGFISAQLVFGVAPLVISMRQQRMTAHR